MQETKYLIVYTNLAEFDTIGLCYLNFNESENV